MYLYPRLPNTSAMELLHDQAPLTPEERSPLAAPEHPAATFAPTGGAAISPGQLLALRREVLAIARSAGYPATITARAARSFDQTCPGVLHRLMEIVPADAGESRVWSFLTCVLIPELTPWRFPGAPEERYITRTRNTLGRLWWRAEILGTTEDDPPGRLGEDILVQVMERPSLAGDRRVARALCSATLSYSEESGLSAPDLMRDAIKRVIRLNAFLSLSALDDAALQKTIDECFSNAERALRARPLGTEEPAAGPRSDALPRRRNHDE